MSTQGKRPFRPALHFSPPKNWTNDPNGLVFANGVYHLFYQHNPDATHWGPMHWGHAICKDDSLAEWEHLPIALYPDELGAIFSGSAVFDKNNTSGFGTKENPPIVAIFTHHGEREQQSIAYSLDGVNFTLYDGNPVIKNTILNDFRDPKVFWHETDKMWKMVLAAFDRVHLYESADLKNWSKTSEWGMNEKLLKGVWECPDLFKFDTEDGEKWVLVVSMGMGLEYGGVRTQYFVGTYDGKEFVKDENFNEVAFVDSGFDSYAGVTYDNTSERIMIAWSSNGHYADKTPTGEYCCIMTMPHILGLKKTSKGYRLSTKFTNLSKYFGESKKVDSNSACFAVNKETFFLNIKGEGASSIVMKNKDNQELRISINEQNELLVDRSSAGDNSFSTVYTEETFQKRNVKRLFEGAYDMQILFDVSSCEILVDSGTICFSFVVFPDSPYTECCFTKNLEVSISEIK